MPKKKRRDTQEKQSQRFVETAKALEADESGKAFENAIGSIVSAKDSAKVVRQSRSKKQR